ncbi:hypothetical protein M9458_012788, partial [Cirrhinus mrigala]
ILRLPKIQQLTEHMTSNQRLVKLRQGNRPIEQYVLDFCELCHLVDFNESLRKDISSKMPSRHRHWSLIRYIEYALLLARSAFTVGIANDKPCHPPVSATPECLHVMSSIITIMPEPPHAKPAKPEPVQVMSTKPQPAHVTSSAPGPAHTMPAAPGPAPVMAALPESAHKMAAIPEPVHKMAAIPEPVHKMATPSESPAKMDAMPEPHQSKSNPNPNLTLTLLGGGGYVSKDPGTGPHFKSPL